MWRDIFEFVRTVSLEFDVFRWRKGGGWLGSRCWSHELGGPLDTCNMPNLQFVDAKSYLKGRPKPHGKNDLPFLDSPQSLGP